MGALKKGGIYWGRYWNLKGAMGGGIGFPSSSTLSWKLLNTTVSPIPSLAFDAT